MAEHQTALDAYMERMQKIEAQMRAIQDALTDRVAPDDVHWGHVGDLSYVQEALDNALGQLNYPDSEGWGPEEQPKAYLR